MAVRVRLFAAIRDAAGTGEAEAAAGPLGAVLADLSDRYGEVFRSRLSACTVLVDGTAVPHGADLEVGDGTEIALLPPVSGG